MKIRSIHFMAVVFCAMACTTTARTTRRAPRAVSPYPTISNIASAGNTSSNTAANRFNTVAEVRSATASENNMNIDTRASTDTSGSSVPGSAAIGAAVTATNSGTVTGGEITGGKTTAATNLSLANNASTANSMADASSGPTMPISAIGGAGVSASLNNPTSAVSATTLAAGTATPVYNARNESRLRNTTKTKLINAANARNALISDTALKNNVNITTGAGGTTAEIASILSGTATGGKITARDTAGAQYVTAANNISSTNDVGYSSAGVSVDNTGTSGGTVPTGTPSNTL